MDPPLTPKGMCLTKPQCFHAYFNFIANWVELHASLLGGLVSHFEKSIYFHAFIFILLILGSFQHFQNVLFIPSSVFPPVF
jgi:hypothetical protein